MKLPQHDNQRPRPPQKTTKKYSRLVRYSLMAFFMLLGGALLVFVILRIGNVSIGRDSTVDKPITDVLNMADQHKLKSVLISGNDIFATSKTGQKYHTFKEDGQPITNILRHD